MPYGCPAKTWDSTIWMIQTGIEKYLKRNPSTCFIAEQGDAIVGVVLAGHDGHRGFIHHMVAENCRRQGMRDRPSRSGTGSPEGRRNQ